MSMKPEIKKDWVAALRDGSYEQGKGQLRNSENKFCCLGVLCDLAEQAGVVTAEYDKDDGYYYGGNNGYLPEVVREWAGLDRDDPEVQYEDEYDHRSLSALNDEGSTFFEIADLVEAQL